jgi:chloride channel 3/4/5
MCLQDLLTNMNSYPFLDNKHKPVFTGDLADIVPRVRRERVIDITNSPVVSAPNLRKKLEMLHRAGELDGGLPIVRHDVLVGLIPAPDLEYALDQLEDEISSLCLMERVQSVDEEDDTPDPTDFTKYIDPVSLLLCPRHFSRLMLINSATGSSSTRHQVTYGSCLRMLR